MIIALLLAAAAPQTAVDAERAFAAMAQKEGQWTAFRAFATDDATMFVPQPVNAQEFLKPLKDPPKAIEWSPAASFVSCDGTMAANTGPWTRPDGAVGYFSTIWVKQSGGEWKWTVDGGDGLDTARPSVARATVRAASCDRRALRLTIAPMRSPRRGAGASADGTLIWQYSVARDGSRRFNVSLWNGRDHDVVIDDHIAAPGPAPKP